MPILHRDFETRSFADLKKVGAQRYAADPTTEVRIVCFAVDDGPVETWLPAGEPIPQVFAEAAKNPAWFVAAHNDAFESATEENVLAPRYGFPLTPIERHVCTLATAQFHGLPGALDKVAARLALPVQKDEAGKRLMLRLSKPKRGNDGVQRFVEPTPDEWARWIAYCVNDVAAEREAYRRLPPLPSDEAELWRLDRRINLRGFCVDTDLANKAGALVQAEHARIDDELHALTGGAVSGSTKLNAMVEFVNRRGHAMTKLNKRAVSAVLARGPDDTVRQVLSLRQAGANTAVKKFAAVAASAFPDQRVRGILHYYGAHTGRWTSAGLNPHNLPREDRADAAAVIAAVQSGDLERVRAFGPPIEAIAGVARGLVTAPLGKRLVIGDFSMLESRVTAWLAGENWKLDNFRKFDATGDPELEPYCVLASKLFKRKVTPDDAAARQRGKTADLAFGFAGSVGAWRRFMPDDPRSDEAIKRAEVDAFRRLHPATVTLWHNLERAALQCVRTGEPVARDRFAFEIDEDSTLQMILPSGRRLFYREVEIGPGRFGDVIFYRNTSLTYARKLTETEKSLGKVELGCPSLVENLVQATGRDLLVNALMKLDAAGFEIVLHVHDEIIAEVDADKADCEAFQRCMLDAPDWALDLPLMAKVRDDERYIKATDLEPRPSSVGNGVSDIPACSETALPSINTAENAPIDIEPAIDEAPIRAASRSENAALAAFLAAPSAPPPPPPRDDAEFEPPDEPPRGNGRDDGNGFTDDFGDSRGWGESESGGQVAEYVYRDLKGAPYLKVAKYAPGPGRKSFPQYHWADGQWVKGKPKGPAIPYRLPELLAAPPGAKLFISEGEKDADTLAALGLIATTNPGGAGKWTPDLNKWLSGFPAAVILEDNDEAGRTHVAKVASALAGTIPELRVLTFRELPEHGDVTDFIEAGGTLEELLARAAQAPTFAALESVCAADVEMVALDWLWLNRIALGKIALLVGLPDEGKGLCLSDIMAHISRAMAWPCGEGFAPLGNVVLLTAEDDDGDTIVPRLTAAGADLKRVHIIKMMREAGQERMFSLISDLGAMRQKVAEIGDVKMIVVDPITAYLGIGEIDSFRATDVRAVLGPWKEFAEERHLSVLGVLHFNKKTDITNVLLRVSDSLAYGAAARHVYGIVDDPDNQRKLFVKGKNNLAPRDQKTLAFSFAEREVGTDKKTGAEIVAPYIVWAPEPVDITANEAMAAAADNKSPSARDDAKRFIETLLSGGPVGATDVLEAAEANGIAERTLKRAKRDLKVEARKDGPIVNGERTWLWHPAGT